MREFVVATFVHNDDRERAARRGRFAKRDVTAYTLWYGDGWDGIRKYTVTARSGIAAKKAAVEMRIAGEVDQVERRGWGWWRAQ